MKIEHLKLTNFRNYDQLELDFNKNINLFIGNNGQGKTNILESIYVLALTKSHRSFIDNNLIKAGEEKEITFTQNIDLQGGEYLISLGVTGYEGDKFQVYHRLYDVLNITFRKYLLL